MTPTQLESIKKEFEDKFTYKFVDLHAKRWTEDDAENVWQFIESKLQAVEEEKVNNEPSWRCGKCDQEEMISKGIAIVCPIPEHSIRCPLRDKSNKLKNKDEKD